MHFKLLICVSSVLVQVYSFPSETREKRQAESSAGASSLASASGASSLASGASSGTNQAVESNSGEFGLGAAAGIGGLGRSAGIGNFQADTKTNPFLPWGAFAGLNLGRGQRLGAGCSGLSCGVQLGNFVLATPQLLGTGTNFGNRNDLDQQQQQQRTSQRLFNRRLDTNDAEDGESLKTSETFLTGVTLRERVDSVSTFLQDMFRGFQETLASFFRRPNASSSRSSISLAAPTTSSTTSSNNNSTQQQTYRIVLGSSSNSKIVAVTLPPVVNASENDITKSKSNTP